MMDSLLAEFIAFLLIGIAFYIAAYIITKIKEKFIALMQRIKSND